MKAASIIVLTTDFTAEYTKKCLEAIQTNAVLPHELFVSRDYKDSLGFGNSIGINLIWILARVKGIYLRKWKS